ncbi:MAG: desulfoferrodoxin family protein [Calditrichia bacterium]
MQFSDMFKAPEAEGKEKHVPVIELEEGGVRVTVGKEVAHPNTAEHHIAWVELYGVTKHDMVIYLGKADFAPGFTEPNALFAVKKEEFKTFFATAYCNLHGVWQNSLNL